ncbi:hypothetical protein I6A94_27280 [Frankia sp. CN4]|nr:hypothetical protein [Frankia nepalensis]
MQMLANRNLKRSDAARVFALLTPMYLSATVYASIGHGRKDLTVDLLAGFAAVLGVHLGDLAAVAGLEPLDEELLPDQKPMDIAELIWDLRRLTVDQVLEIRREAESLMEYD